ncbi:MAG: RNA polymerase sigma factor [Rhodopirellula sp. JB055]|uniref:RNA polymerase sigma factor n=1 Tax=Rhodopirellula sp. JB055 TaxID=3342846 RepID=UPI00370B8342
MSNSILERIAAGEHSAVGDCLDQYGRLVWSLARRLAPTAEDAEDAVQEAFVSIWQNASRFDSEKSTEVTFIAMIARRRIIDRMRRGIRPTDCEVGGGDLLVNEQADESATAGSRAAELADEARKADGCLRKLSVEQQKVIDLSIHRGLSHGKISEVIGMPLGTVKSNARRALLSLKDCMKRQGHGQVVAAADPSGGGL